MPGTCAKIVSIISKHWVRPFGPSGDAYLKEDGSFYRKEDGGFYLIE